MKPLFSSDEDAQAASAQPVAPAPGLAPHLAPLLTPDTTSATLPALRPETGVTPAPAAPLALVAVPITVAPC